MKFVIQLLLTDLRLRINRFLFTHWGLVPLPHMLIGGIATAAHHVINRSYLVSPPTKGIPRRQ